MLWAFMWESQVLLTDGQVFFFFLGFSGLRPPLRNNQLDISEIFLKNPKFVKPKSKKKKCCGHSLEHLSETLILSTHNICFHEEIGKILVLFS